MKFLIGFGLLFLVIGVIITFVWMLFFRQRFTLWGIIKQILGLALLPFKLLFRLFGNAEEVIATPSLGDAAAIDIQLPDIQECPPCPDSPAASEDCKPLEMEISYLKNMVRFVGSMAKRENAINAQYRELYPGFSVMSGDVRRLSYEYNFLKNQLREDDNQWTYFKNYFTKLSGVPSASSAVHYDLML